MRKLVYHVGATLDGAIAGPGEEIDFFPLSVTSGRDEPRPAVALVQQGRHGFAQITTGPIEFVTRIERSREGRRRAGPAPGCSLDELRERRPRGCGQVFEVG